MNETPDTTLADILTAPVDLVADICAWTLEAVYGFVTRVLDGDLATIGQLVGFLFLFWATWYCTRPLATRGDRRRDGRR